MLSITLYVTGGPAGTRRPSCVSLSVPLTGETVVLDDPVDAGATGATGADIGVYVTVGCGKASGRTPKPTRNAQTVAAATAVDRIGLALYLSTRFRAATKSAARPKSVISTGFAFQAVVVAPRYSARPRAPQSR